MKTIKEWLEELKPEHRELSIKNAVELSRSPTILLATHEESLSEAIAGAFAWNKTQQGHDYWEEIYFEILEGTYYDTQH
jgi:hypothetical protein